MKLVNQKANSTQELTPEVLKECQHLMLEKKQELFSRILEVQADYRRRDNEGDEVDKSTQLMSENQMLSTIDQFRQLLFEIETALARMERGQYGICEETEERIEIERLKAIPWTRLSIEGAEIREELTKRYATR